MLLSACQASPEKAVVVSKSDGSFDANAVVSASEHHDPDATQPVSYTESFTSTDGSVTFLLTVDQQVTAADMPVVEVKPHFFTEEDAKRAATALFGDANFYEQEPDEVNHLSKSEIQEKLQRWSQFTSEDALDELYGSNAHGNAIPVIQKFIQEYTELCETASVEGSHVPAQWQFRKGFEYFMLPDEIAELPESELSTDNDEICLQTTVNDIPYAFSVSNRDQKDFKVNMLFAFIEGGMGPNNLDDVYFKFKVCQTPEPTQEQVDAIRKKAETILEEMDLGQWKVDRCYWEARWGYSSSQYIVHVDAVPVLNGMAAIRQPQLDNLRNEDAYASNYYYTDVNFEFSANGDLVRLWMYSPLDIVETVNPNVAVQSFDDMMETAKQYLSYSDMYAYSFGPFVGNIDEDVNCTVTISQLDYNLMRVKVPNSDDHYYYVPGITLRGVVRYEGKNSGKLYYESVEPELLVAINGVDGSIIQLG